MLSRLIKCQVELQNPRRGALPPVATLRRGTSMPTVDKSLAAGMGTRNFISDILDTFAALDRDGKQKLVNYSSQLAEEQRLATSA